MYINKWTVSLFRKLFAGVFKDRTFSPERCQNYVEEQRTFFLQVGSYLCYAASLGHLCKLPVFLLASYRYPLRRMSFPPAKSITFAWHRRLSTPSHAIFLESSCPVRLSRTLASGRHIGSRFSASAHSNNCCWPKEAKARDKRGGSARAMIVYRAHFLRRARTIFTRAQTSFREGPSTDESLVRHGWILVR